MQKITPFVWFNGKVDEAASFYTSIFKNAKIISQGGPMSVTVNIEGQELILFNGGPMFKLTEAFSLMVSCDTQEEIDDKWEKLSAGGEKSRCGWLKDKHGLWWQIIPPILGQYLSDPDPIKSKNVMDAMMQMDKIDIQKLEDAYAQS